MEPRRSTGGTPPRTLDPSAVNVYRDAWPTVKDLIWGIGNEQRQAERKLRRFNQNLHGFKIKPEVYVRISERLLQAALRVIQTNDNKDYRTIRDHYNRLWQAARYPEEFRIKDQDFREFCNTVRVLLQEEEERIQAEQAEQAEDEEIGPEVGNTYASNEQITPNRQHGQENEYDTDELNDSYAPHNPEERHARPGPDDYDSEGFLNPEDEEEVTEEANVQSDNQWERNYVSIDDLRSDTERVWGSLMTEGEILAYRMRGSMGYSVIVGYSCDDQQIARVEPRARRPLPVNTPHIGEKSKARKRLRNGQYRNRSHITGFGLIAWKVDGRYDEDPTSVLRPSRKAYYPETYVQVYWKDQDWTWESRDGLRFVYGGDPYNVDVLIYRQAISQEGNYQEALTGYRPEYPDGSSMANKHWRNENALGGAYWLHPRAKETKRAVKLEEEDATDIKVKDEDDFLDEQQFARDFEHGSFGDEPELDTNPLRAEQSAENGHRNPRSGCVTYHIRFQRDEGAELPIQRKHAMTLQPKDIDQVRVVWLEEIVSSIHPEHEKGAMARPLRANGQMEIEAEPL
ncbi:hypothetical protein BJX65DRAFT_315365 [Aspergillus insuetus]